MESFTTDFLMSGVDTTVTVRIASGNEFDFVIHLEDAFDGGLITPSENERDGTLLRKEDGTWELEKDCKVHLSEQDIKSLGAAIERDYFKHQGNK